MRIIFKSPNTKEEFAKYYQLRWEILRKSLGQKQGSELDEYESLSHHVMAIDNDIVGVGRIHEIGAQEFQIRYMGIREEYQNLKIGSKLLSELEVYAKSSGAKKVILHAREKALSLYIKNGYKIIKKSHKLMDVIQHYLMEKEI